MLYSVTFSVSRNSSGYATYLAHLAGGFSPPYQKPLPDDMCQQFFYFHTIEKVNEFLRTAFKELVSQKFSVQSIVCERSGKEQ